MEVLEALRTRRSIGKLDGEVTDGELRQLVEAGLWAPNHKLTDRLHFVAIRGDARERLGRVWAEAAGAHESPPGVTREKFLEKEARKPLRAPLLLAVGVRTDASAEVAEEDFATAAAAVQNVLLAAHALGLGAIWRTGGMVGSAAVRDHLGFAPTDRIVGIVYVGRPAMDPPAPQPRDVDGHLTILT
jgi:nitroreductase